MDTAPAWLPIYLSGCSPGSRTQFAEVMGLHQIRDLPLAIGRCGEIRTPVNLVPNQVCSLYTTHRCMKYTLLVAAATTRTPV